MMDEENNKLEQNENEEHEGEEETTETEEHEEGKEENQIKMSDVFDLVNELTKSIKSMSDEILAMKQENAEALKKISLGDQEKQEEFSSVNFLNKYANEE